MGQDNGAGTAQISREAPRLERTRAHYVGEAREWLYIARQQRLIGQHDNAELSLRRAAGNRRAAFVVISGGAQ